MFRFDILKIEIWNFDIVTYKTNIEIVNVDGVSKFWIFQRSRQLHVWYVMLKLWHRNFYFTALDNTVRKLICYFYKINKYFQSNTRRCQRYTIFLLLFSF